MQVAAPGEPRQVLDLVTLLEAAPFDPDLAPWDVTLIEGVDGGRAAIYLRAHHALSDGVGGVSLLRALLDEPTPGVPAAPAVATPRRRASRLGPGSRRPRTVTINLDVGSAIRPVAASVSAAMSAAPVHTLMRGVQRSLDLASSVSHQVLPNGGPLSPLPPSRSPTSRFEVLSVPGARAAALALGGSRNDLVIAAAAAGFGRYLERADMPTPELRLAMPVGRRLRRNAWGNGFAPLRVDIPAMAVNPGPHFGVVVERLARARREPALRLARPLGATADLLPIRLLRSAMRHEVDDVDFVATALPGLRDRAQICGARVEESYPFGPRLGCPVNVTALGNGGRLDIGISLSPTAITEPQLFVQCVDEAFQAMVGTPPVLSAEQDSSP